jgi:hypothetical protein
MTTYYFANGSQVTKAVNGDLGMQVAVGHHQAYKRHTTLMGWHINFGKPHRHTRREDEKESAMLAKFGY